MDCTISAIATIPSIASVNNNLTQSSQGYNISNPNTRAIQDGEEKTASFRFISEDEAKLKDWWGKQKVDNITNEQIKSLLIPYDSTTGGDLSDVNFNIQIQSITNDDRRNGGVRFTITQIVKNYNNGILDETTPTKEVKIKKPGATGVSDADYEWSTYANYSTSNTTNPSITIGGNFQGMAIIEKYNFAWNDDEIIGEYIKNTFNDRVEASHEKISDDAILANFVKQDDNHIIPSSDYEISIKNTTQINNDGTKDYTNWDKYGLMEISIRFNNTDKTDWLNNKYPDGATEGQDQTDLKTKWIKLTKVFRGFYSKDGEVSNTNVFLDLSSTETIVNTTIDKATDNPFSKYLLNNETKLSDLMPSELKELSLNNNALLNFMYNKSWNANSNGDSLVKLSYFGKDVRNFNDDANDNYILPKDYRDSSIINKIEVTPNDFDGSATFTYYYDYYDVYSGKIVKNAIYNQQFPAGSFKKNPDANKQLVMSAKAPNEINSFTSSKDLMDLYEANKSNKIYLKSLSNLFLNGTSDALSKDRDVVFEYVNETGSTAASPTTRVKMTLTFDSWNGESYESNGNKVEGKQIIQIFDFPSSTISFNVNWKENQNVIDDINNIIKTTSNDPNKINVEDFTPSEIVDLLYSNNSLNTAFTSGLPNNVTLSYFSDNSTGSLIVKAQSNIATIQSFTSNNISTRNTNSGEIQTRIFTGFKTTNDEFQEFGWIGNSEVEATLLQKELESITVDDVINQYLNKINFFNGMNLSSSNVQIEKNPTNGTLTIYVTVSAFNQDAPTANNKFSTVLRGFPVGTTEDKNSYKAPVDLTIILSAILGGIVVLGLGGYLGKTILNRIKTNKIKNKF